MTPSEAVNEIVKSTLSIEERILLYKIHRREIRLILGDKDQINLQKKYSKPREIIKGYTNKNDLKIEIEKALSLSNDQDITDTLLDALFDLNNLDEISKEKN